MDFVFGERGSGKTHYGLQIAHAEAAIHGKKVAILPISPLDMWVRLLEYSSLDPRTVHPNSASIHFGRGTIYIISSLEDLRGLLIDLLWYDEPDTMPIHPAHVSRVLVTMTTPDDIRPYLLTGKDTARILEGKMPCFI